MVSSPVLSILASEGTVATWVMDVDGMGRNDQVRGVLPLAVNCRVKSVPWVMRLRQDILSITGGRRVSTMFRVKFCTSVPASLVARTTKYQVPASASAEIASSPEVLLMETNLGSGILSESSRFQVIGVLPLAVRGCM